MADNVTLTRVIDLVAQESISDGDYTLIDSVNGGTKKYNLVSLAAQISGGGLTEDIKQALLQIARKVIYLDDDSPSYYEALYDALYPPADLVSISAVYTQSGTVYETTSLDSLKSDLVVTGHYADSTTRTITAYTLSGTLTVGTSTVTVAYGGKTTTFNVTVSEQQIEYLYNWDFTKSLIDSVSNREAVIGAKSGTAAPTQDSNGLTFDAATQYAYLGEVDVVGKTIEMDIASFDFKGNTSYHIRLLSNNQYNTANGYGLGALIWRSTAGSQGWRSYGYSSDSSSGTDRTWSANCWSADLEGNSAEVLNAFSGKTLKVVYHSDGHTKDLYIDGVYTGTINDVYFNTVGATHLSDKIYIAGAMSLNQNSGDQCYDMTVTGVRIYANAE